MVYEQKFQKNIKDDGDIVETYRNADTSRNLVVQEIRTPVDNYNQNKKSLFKNIRVNGNKKMSIRIDHKEIR